MNEALLRQQLATFSRRVWEQGWVANHDGNLSLRLPRGRFMCTPTAFSKGDLKAEMMLVVDGAGKVLSGNLRPFSELNLHLAWYQTRPDVQAVIHAHPVTATALGVAGAPLLDQAFLPEAVVSLGAGIPTVPLSLPGSDALQAAAPWMDEHDALLLAGNGVITCGVDLEQAYLRLELVEHLARIAVTAHQVGGVQPLPAHFLGPLLAARTKAGLGPEARGGPGEKSANGATVPGTLPPRRVRRTGQPAGASGPDGSSGSTRGTSLSGEQLADLVRQEIRNVLKSQ